MLKSVNTLLLCVNLAKFGKSFENENLDLFQVSNTREIFLTHCGTFPFIVDVAIPRR